MGMIGERNGSGSTDISEAKLQETVRSIKIEQM